EIEIEIEIGIGIGIDNPVLYGTWPSQNRNKSVALPGFSCPNPIQLPFDTHPDPELASPSNYSDGPGPSTIAR
ncbi:MAG: hypothetical protein QM518_14615, partial [Verrucomicrobiota bacterium]|nr:hypothetical protein [Verrucomicrobiota bacterium]